MPSWLPRSCSATASLRSADCWSNPMNQIETQDDAEAELAVTVPERFAVTDEASANWLVRKVLEARRYAERVEAWAAAEMRRARRDEAFLLGRFGSDLEH